MVVKTVRSLTAEHAGLSFLAPHVQEELVEDLDDAVASSGGNNNVWTMTASPPRGATTATGWASDRSSPRTYEPGAAAQEQRRMPAQTSVPAY